MENIQVLPRRSPRREKKRWKCKVQWKDDFHVILLLLGRWFHQLILKGRVLPFEERSIKNWGTVYLF